MRGLVLVGVARTAAVQFCAGDQSSSWPRIEAAHYCVNVLGDDQEGLAQVFAGKGEDKFSGIGWRPSAATGAPVLNDVLAWIDAHRDGAPRGRPWIVRGALDLEIGPRAARCSSGVEPLHPLIRRARLRARRDRADHRPHRLRAPRRGDHRQRDAGPESSVWPGAVLRATGRPSRSAPQLDPGRLGAARHPAHPTKVGAECVIGHGPPGGCTIEDGAVGSGAVVLHDAVVRTGALVGAGAVVSGGSRFRRAMALRIRPIRPNAVDPDRMIRPGMLSYVGAAPTTASCSAASTDEPTWSSRRGRVRDGAATGVRLLRVEPWARPTTPRPPGCSAASWPSGPSAWCTGGAHVGLMGAVAGACRRAGGEVIGVIPGSLVEAEVAHTGLDDLRIVSTMHERRPSWRAVDGFVALPGGFGTWRSSARCSPGASSGCTRRQALRPGRRGRLLRAAHRAVRQRRRPGLPPAREPPAGARGRRPAHMLDALAGWRRRLRSGSGLTRSDEFRRVAGRAVGARAGRGRRGCSSRVRRR